jgi:hypothetical protein
LEVEHVTQVTQRPPFGEDSASDALAEGTVDAVVIGGGAAGLNGALILARSRRSVVVIDSAARTALIGLFDYSRRYHQSGLGLLPTSLTGEYGQVTAAPAEHQAQYTPPDQGPPAPPGR